MTFTIRYRDDSAVDASSFDSSDVYVNTPEGFNLSAELLSVSGGPIGNGWQKFATYRVTLPASSPPLASLHVVLRTNQMKDINNNVASAGTLAFAPGDNAGWDLLYAHRPGHTDDRSRFRFD